MIPPPVPCNEIQHQQDDNHLKLLSVFHFVLGGFALLGIVFLALHYLLMNQIMVNAQPTKGGPPPKEIFQVLFWFYLFMGVVLVVMSALNILSGMFLLKRKNRMFSLVVAGIDCIQVPLGTVLGVFTLIVLQRPSVRASYDAASSLPR